MHVTTQFKPEMGIYALAHPDTGRVMYVGQSIDVDRRYRTHRDYFGANSNLRLQTWIAELRSSGKGPQFQLLENVGTASELDDTERKWIRHFKSKGEAELNLSIGGKNRVKSRSLNSHPDEWIQFAADAQRVRALLTELAAASTRIASVNTVTPY
jgi:hypothetical protein